MARIDQQDMKAAFLKQLKERDPVGSAAGEVPVWDLLRRPSPKPDVTLSVSSGFPVTPIAKGD